MEKIIPEFLIEKIKNQYNNDEANLILNGLKKDKKTTFRVNRIKADCAEIEKELVKKNIKFEKNSIIPDAYILDENSEEIVRQLDVYKNGCIYMQSLSSMIPVIALDPMEKENIFDMCAAPGGKTTQIASRTNNTAFITACEKNKIRFDRLKFNLEKQGVKNYNLMREDSRNLSDFFKFDKILLDSPCSR